MSRVLGPRYDGTVRLNLAALQAKADAAGLATGMPSSQVTIAVTPNVRGARGTVFSPALTLSLSPLQLSLAGGPKSLTVTDPTAATTVSGAPRGRVVSLVGHSMPASTVRTWSLLLLALSALSAAVIVLLARRGRGATEGVKIHRHYSALLVPVEPIAAVAGRPIVDVTEIATLAKLAERYGLLVLNWSRSGVETFIVQDENTTYRFRTAPPARPGKRKPAATRT